MEEKMRELQLLPTPSSTSLSAWKSDSYAKSRSKQVEPFDGPPSLDLQLSISVKSFRPPSNCFLSGSIGEYTNAQEIEWSCIKALKWQAAEQIRAAAAEKAYAEQVREMTRQEMGLAQAEFARARLVWERAQEEVKKAERLKERATSRIDSACMEITCQACKKRFRA